MGAHHDVTSVPRYSPIIGPCVMAILLPALVHSQALGISCPDVVYALAGQNARLVCNISLDPTGPSLVMYRGNEELVRCVRPCTHAESQRYELDVDVASGEMVFTIQSVVPSDKGLYTCFYLLKGQASVQIYISDPLIARSTAPSTALSTVPSTEDVTSMVTSDSPTTSMTMMTSLGTVVSPRPNLSSTPKVTPTDVSSIVTSHWRATSSAGVIVGLGIVVAVLLIYNAGVTVCCLKQRLTGKQTQSEGKRGDTEPYTGLAIQPQSVYEDLHPTAKASQPSSASPPTPPDPGAAYYVNQKIVAQRAAMQPPRKQPELYYVNIPE